jgi:hypothetical protein
LDLGAELAVSIPDDRDLIDGAKDGLTGKEFGELLQHWAFGTPATRRVTVMMSPFTTFTVEGRSIDFLAYYSLSRIVLVLSLRSRLTWKGPSPAST